MALPVQHGRRRLGGSRLQGPALKGPLGGRRIGRIGGIKFGSGLGIQ